MTPKPYPKAMRLTFEQVLEETIAGMSYSGGPRGEYGGHPLIGDIFYSNISYRLRPHKLECRFSEFCRALEAAGFWVHS